MAEKIEVRLLIDGDLVTWFRDNYPKGSLTWVVENLMTEFKKAHAATPLDYAVIGARELKKRIDEEKAGEETSR